MIDREEVRDRWTVLERSVFRLIGPDRVRFLNGQVSNDVSGPLEEEAAPACICSLKGKVEALVWISARDDALVLDGEARQREAILARLDRYLIADDCEIHDESEQWTLVHHFREEGGGVASRRLAVAGRDLWWNAGELPGWDEERRLTPEEFLRLSVRSRIPESDLEITGDEFPAELGLDSWAVDFKKGCYLGQEVVSRIESVGRVKKRLRAVVSGESIERGASLENELGEKGKATRDFLAGEEKKFVGMGLFKIDPKSEQVPDREPVTAKVQP